MAETLAWTGLDRVLLDSEICIDHGHAMRFLPPILALLLLLPQLAWGDLLNALAAIEGKDYATAISELRPLAEKGQAQPQFLLGKLLLEGRGGAPAIEDGVDLITRSAEQNYGPAQAMLGFLYANGIGVARDPKAAEEWLNSSLERLGHGPVRANAEATLAMLRTSAAASSEAPPPDAAPVPTVTAEAALSPPDAGVSGDGSALPSPEEADATAVAGAPEQSSSEASGEEAPSATPETPTDSDVAAEKIAQAGPADDESDSAAGIAETQTGPESGAGELSPDSDQATAQNTDIPKESDASAPASALTGDHDAIEPPATAPDLNVDPGSADAEPIEVAGILPILAPEPHAPAMTESGKPDDTMVSSPQAHSAPEKKPSQPEQASSSNSEEPAISQGSALENAGSSQEKPQTAEIVAPGAPTLSDIHIQLAAVPSGAQAEDEWRRIYGRNKQLLEGLKPIFRTIDLGEMGVFQRIQAGPFQNLDEAKDLCTKLIAAGQDCLVMGRQK